MSPAGGRAFGPYRLLRSVAADAVTTTYAATMDGGAAEHGDTGRFLVRIAAPVDVSDAHTSEVVRGFLAESQRAGVINHPSVIRPHDLGVIDGRPYVATPYVRAVPLGDMLMHGGAISDAAALAIFAQLAAALDAGHRVDVTHGALSPRTIWVGPSAGGGAAYIGYLTGFGTGLLLRDHLAVESGGAPVDDVLYVAPEQLRGEPATRASDQYSLACALYHTVVGQPPFERDTRAKLYGAHLMAPAPLLAPEEAIAETTGTALQRGMSKQPSDRFDSCGLLVNAALPAAMIPPSRGGAFRQSAATGDDGRRPWVLVLAAVGLLLAGVVLWLLLRPAGTPQVTAGRSVPTGVIGATPLPQDLPARWSATVADAPVAKLVVEDGVILATSDDGTLVGVRPAAGRIGWRASVEDLRSLTVGGAAVVAGPDALTAFDLSDGSERWRAAEILEPMQVTENAVIGSYETASAAGIRALALDDGRELWHTRGPSDTGAVTAALTVQTGGDTFVYALQGGALMAIDQSQATATGDGRRRVAEPTWQVDADDAWPALAPTGSGVAVATEDGQVCLHARRSGVVMWCEMVPGSDAEQPSLVWTRAGLVASTTRAVMVLDGETGAPLWSVSPGSPGNVVAASHASVAVADGDGGASILDAATGDVLMAVAGLGDVTAIAAHQRWVVVGTGDGRVHRFDLPNAG